MPNRNLVIDTIAKIEGNAALKILIEDESVSDLQFIVSDYRRFFTTAVRGQRVVAVPSFLSRICGTCSVAHLFASLMAVESAQGIVITEQTKALRRLAYDGLMIRDHALHLYFFVLPDILGVDSILDVPDDPDDLGHILLHDSFDIKRLGTDISNAVIGAAIHAPWPTIGGSLKNSKPTGFSDLIAQLEAVRPKVLRGTDTFLGWGRASSETRTIWVYATMRDSTFSKAMLSTRMGDGSLEGSSRTTCNTCRSRIHTQGPGDALLDAR